MKNLVIVESPSKSKTIEKYLGKDYKVTSSKGHIRDLATSGKFGFGVDVNDNFKPDYKAITGKSKIISELKKEALNADHVILATDPDREGEAISWHLKEALGIKEENYGRVVFNEITKDAIVEAFKHPRKIDDDLVHSQETRRILDRIIGFRLSKLMRNKTEGKSAGRVQSVALKLIVDREREIEAFNAQEYWSIEAHFTDFDAMLDKYKGKKVVISNEVEASDILSKLSNAFKIKDSVDKEISKKSKFPFTTSTLTQMASNRLGYTASKTMRIAQKLYEGIKTDEGLVGLISYMRTDSTRFSEVFIKDTYRFISGKYGKEYIGFAKQAKKKDNVQDAHEAIRPTSIDRTPEDMKPYLTLEEYKIYNLIYVRSLSSLMADAKVLKTTVTLDNNGYDFIATGQIYKFPGYLKVYGQYEDTEDKILPDFSSYKSDVIVSKAIEKIQHFTEPPARYTEGSLIKMLEKVGVGRPSTYAKIIDILKMRDYIEIIEKKFHPTKTGITITDKLQEFFSNIINVEYTAGMENDLDKIALGEEVWYQLLDRFYKEFEPLVENAFTSMEKEEPESTGEVCPLCGKDLVIRTGKYGKFTACSGYPECKYIKKEEKVIVEVCDCPKCGEGKIIERKTRRGKVFYGCSNYPKCKNALWDKPTGELCTKCGSLLVDHKGQIICPECEKETSK
ncbi:MAG: type I DNA topoisomerase [Bacilli bacterium]